MNDPLNQARIGQSPDPWHPWPDADWMLATTDLGIKSVVALLLTDSAHRLPSFRERNFAGDELTA